MQNKTYDAIVLLSGGIDSTTILHQLTAQGKKVICLIFDYGQTLKKEVDIAISNARRNNQDYKVVTIDLSFANSKCSLISDTEILSDRTFEQIDGGTPSSYVEFRNGILLAYCVHFAEVYNIKQIYGGFNGLASGQYYDDTLEFIDAFAAAANKGTSPEFKVEIFAPYSKIDKSDIVKRGLSLGIDYGNTWSCYHNGDKHCLKCDSCKQRIRALNKGGANE